MNEERLQEIYNDVVAYGGFPEPQQEDEFTTGDFLEYIHAQGRTDVTHDAIYKRLMQMMKKGKLTGRKTAAGIWLFRHVSSKDK